jgi:hypothetical protein
MGQSKDRVVVAGRRGMGRWASNFHPWQYERSRAAGFRWGSKRALRRTRRRLDPQVIDQELLADDTERLIAYEIDREDWDDLARAEYQWWLTHG